MPVLWDERRNYNDEGSQAWTVLLEKTMDGSLRLSLHESEGSQRAEIVAIAGIQGGASLYAGLDRVFETLGVRRYDEPGSVCPVLTKAFIRKIAEIDASIADQLAIHADRLKRWHLLPLTPEKIDEDLDRAQRAREEAIAPFLSIIDSYVLRFSDERIRLPGSTMYPSKRFWMKKFMEDYVVVYGELPNGLHEIRVERSNGGYRGAPHDFQYDN